MSAVPIAALRMWRRWMTDAYDLQECANVLVAAGDREKGWGPVKWGHHPDIVKKVIRQAHWRPLKKACYENCGRFILAARRQGRMRGLEYAEGWIETLGVHIPHAWLVYKGEILDLTLHDRGDVTYGEHRVMSAKQVEEEILEHRRFGPFLDPMKYAPKVLNEMMQKGWVK